MPKRLIAYIPDAITLMNLVSGCVAIYFTFHLNNSFGCLTGAQWAMIFIGLATVFDFFDGFSARMLKAYSDVGKDLDSLSDLISFGVAPGMLMLNTMESCGAPLWACIFTLAIPVCGAIRLAKFNNDTEQATVFRGLPIPANAIFWIGAFGWISTYAYPGNIAMIVVVLLVSLAMTANFKMFSLKFKNLNFAENFCRYVIGVAAVIFVAIYGLSGFVWTILLYFLLSMLRQKHL